MSCRICSLVFDRILTSTTDLYSGTRRSSHMEVDGGRVLVNPEDVGQPRDEGPRAVYAVLDTETVSVDLHRGKYNVDRAIDKIEEVGFPKSVGIRLLDGS